MTKINRSTSKSAQHKPSPRDAANKPGGKKGQGSAQSGLDKGTGRTSSFDGMRAVGAPSLGARLERTKHVADSRGRMNARGNADDSIGRLNRKGNADDSIGRLNGKGNADDSIGRLNGKGNPDDSIGRDLGFGTGGAQPPYFVKGQPMFGTPSRYSSPKQPIGYAKGQPVYANSGRVQPTTFLKGQAVYSRGSVSQGLANQVSAKEMRRAVSGLNSKAVETAQSLSRLGAASGKVLESGRFQALRASDREAIIHVMDKGGSTAASAMAKLFKEGREGVLQDKDSSGQSVLQNLSAMAKSKHPSLAADVLSNIVDPRGIQQGTAPTCTAATMQYEMAKDDPDEYSRIMRGLAESGRARMPGGGMLEIDTRKAIDASNLKRDFRTDSEAVFQSAVMDYANGRDRYDLADQRSVGANGTYRGLFPDQIRKVTGQLFGAGYETKMILNDDQAREELALLSSRERPNRPVLFDLNMGDYNHNVSLEGVNDKHVTYRDPTTGDIKAIAIKDFIQNLTSVHYAVG